MSERAKEFLQALADLVEKYDATFHYTSADNGIYITVDGRIVFVDFIGFGSVGDGQIAAVKLREAVAED